MKEKKNWILFAFYFSFGGVLSCTVFAFFFRHQPSHSSLFLSSDYVWQHIICAKYFSTATATAANITIHLVYRSSCNWNCMFAYEDILLSAAWLLIVLCAFYNLISIFCVAKANRSIDCCTPFDCITSVSINFSFHCFCLSLSSFDFYVYFYGEICINIEEKEKNWNKRRRGNAAIRVHFN